VQKPQLEAVMRDERRLDRVELADLLEAFDGRDRLAILHRGQRHAGQDAAPVDVNGTRAAFATIATFLGAGQRKLVSQSLEQRDARLDHHRAGLAVDE
jgi:hypothetical protein